MILGAAHILRMFLRSVEKTSWSVALRLEFRVSTCWSTRFAPNKLHRGILYSSR